MRPRFRRFPSGSRPAPVRLPRSHYCEPPRVCWRPRSVSADGSRSLLVVSVVDLLVLGGGHAISDILPGAPRPSSWMSVEPGQPQYGGSPPPGVTARRATISVRRVTPPPGVTARGSQAAVTPPPGVTAFRRRGAAGFYLLVHSASAHTSSGSYWSRTYAIAASTFASVRSRRRDPDFVHLRRPGVRSRTFSARLP